MAETMGEKVAKAIYDAAAAYAHLDGLSVYEATVFATAAIEAMRVQLQEMLDAAETKYMPNGSGCSEDFACAHGEFVMNVFTALEATTSATDTASAVEP